MRWIPYVFVRIVVFFIAGIFLAVYQPESIPLSAAIAAFIGLVALYFFLYFIFRITTPLFNPGSIALAAVFVAGYVHLKWQTEANNPDHILSVSGPIRSYQAVIARFTEEKQKSWKVEAHILAVNSEAWKKKVGKIVLHFAKQDFPTPYSYGDVLLIKGSPQVVQPPSNPGEFDYKRFLAFRNIYHQHFLRAGEAQRIRTEPPSLVLTCAIAARNQADTLLKKFVYGEREQAIASALILGVTDGLDNELLNAYAATGAMHVLAVSGLHISIVYMILAWLLKPLLRLKYGAWILALISLFVLWAYAFITGLSPSVLRAVTMFSFIATARATRQGTNIFNTLAASAFCLLLFDPYLIMSVGFQLSYMAVLGIVYLHPPMYRFWEPRNYLLDQAWNISCVSIAAQMATFALGLLYFHQFPNYFLLSNLLVIPFSFLVLVLGLLVLTVSFFETLAGALGIVLTWSIKILNGVVFTVESFPFSMIENIHITTPGCWLLMAIAISFILLFKYKRFYYSTGAFIFCLLLAVIQWNHFHKNIDIKKFTIYNVHGHTAIDFIDRGNSYFVTDSILLNCPDKVRFHIQPNRLMAGVRNVIPAQGQSFIRGLKGGRIIYFNNRVMVHIWDSNFMLPSILQPDWLVIGNNAIRDFTFFQTAHPSTKIILDSSNSYFYCDQMLEKSKYRKQEIYSVKHRGAYECLLDDSTV